jgi:subtilisin family serine protease
VVLVAGLTVAGASAAYGSERAGYVVVLADSTADPAGTARAHALRFGGAVGHVYRHALRGYSVRLSESAAVALRHLPGVVSVERDQVAYTQAQTVPTGVRRVFADQNPNLDIDGRDDKRVDVDVAVVDTGVDNDHPDLDVVDAIDCHNYGLPNCSTAPDQVDDGNGHGTHVAGTIAAIDNGVGVVGVAPGARIHSVKVLGDSGSGSISGIVRGIDWVVARADTIEVINMSLGCEGCDSDALDTAITSAVDKGIVVVVAAGNSNKDAATFTPANHPDVVTVSAIADSDGKADGTGGAPACRSVERDDYKASFSNFGSTIEVAAPGVCIRSTYKDGGYATLSGTSMASSHVAGAAAVLAGGANKPVNRSGALAVRQKIIDTGNFGWTDTSGDCKKEPLLDVHDGTEYPPGDSGGNQLPVAGFTHTCNLLIGRLFTVEESLEMFADDIGVAASTVKDWRMGGHALRR